MKRILIIFPLMLVLCLIVSGEEKQPKSLLYPGFEYKGKELLPPGWEWEIGGGAKVTIARITDPVHTGQFAMKITNDTPIKGGVFGSLYSQQIVLPADKTYQFSVWVKGEEIQDCYIGVSIVGGGDVRTYFPKGSFDWRRFSVFVSAGEKPIKVSVRVASDNITRALYIDDFEMNVTKYKRSNLEAVREQRPFSGVFPQSQKPPSKQLYVIDGRELEVDIRRMVAVLQGIVNRKEPRIYVINNPQDEFWLTWMKQKGYTGQEKIISKWQELLMIFGGEFNGVIIFDPQLMGSIHAACMLGGLENALPVSPSLSKQLGLPVVADFRGRWQRNVDAYRWVFDNYWQKMNHHLLACLHPLTVHPYVWDYLTEFNVFTFWCSNYGDTEPGNDPAAEEIFVHELYARTPPNIPVLGWYAYADTKGIHEYQGVSLAASYGKFTPGTEFNSNVSVHSGVRVPDAVFKKQKARTLTLPPVQKDKIYVALSILDSGDGQWYWEQYQLKVWQDKNRGEIPISWCLNVTLIDTMPDVLQWYYENATPNDFFFCAISGLGYIITPHFATRFKPEVKEKVWRDFLRLTSEYCKRLDIDMVELHNGAWGEPTPPDDKIFLRYVKEIPGLRAVLADLGRHDNVTADKSSYLLEGVPVFHCLTRWKTWSRSDELQGWDMDKEIRRFVKEIITYTPKGRPGFMNTMPLSWTYFPSIINKVAELLPSDYVVVNVAQLAELFRQHHSKSSLSEIK